MTETLKKKIENCATRKQLEKVLEAEGLKITKDTSTGKNLSVWINELTRIYKPYGSKTLKVQTWKKVKFKYSGTPVFFNNPSYF